jgi:hypothetical protein
MSHETPFNVFCTVQCDENAPAGFFGTVAKAVQRWARRVKLTSDNLVRLQFDRKQNRIFICGSGMPKQIMAALPALEKGIAAAVGIEMTAPRASLYALEQAALR